MLVDQGDIAVAFRVLKDKPVSEHQFTRCMEIVCIPPGHVLTEAEEIGCEYYDTIINQLLTAGLA